MTQISNISQGCIHNSDVQGSSCIYKDTWCFPEKKDDCYYCHTKSMSEGEDKGYDFPV